MSACSSRFRDSARGWRAGIPFHSWMCGPLIIAHNKNPDNTTAVRCEQLLDWRRTLSSAAPTEFLRSTWAGSRTFGFSFMAPSRLPGVSRMATTPAWPRALAFIRGVIPNWMCRRGKGDDKDTGGGKQCHCRDQGRLAAAPASKPPCQHPTLQATHYSILEWHGGRVVVHVRCTAPGVGSLRCPGRPCELNPIPKNSQQPPTPSTANQHPDSTHISVQIKGETCQLGVVW